MNKVGLFNNIIRSKKNPKTTLVNNPDYKFIPERVEAIDRILTERMPNILSSPVSIRRFATDYEIDQDIKRVEIDVMNDGTPSWFSIAAVENNLKSSQSLLKQAMKNYFVFLEFYKKLENYGSKIHNFSSLNELKMQTENLIFNELKGGKEIKMNIDELQDVLQEHESMINTISQINSQDRIEIENSLNIREQK